MDRLFFDVMDHDAIVHRDHHGREMPGLDAAEIEAARALKRIREEWSSAGKTASGLNLLVYDATGKLVASLPSLLRMDRAGERDQVAA